MKAFNMEPFSRVYLSMSTLVEKGIVKGRVLFDNVIQEGLELCPNHFSIATEGSGCTPVQMILAGLYPLDSLLWTFLISPCTQVNNVKNVHSGSLYKCIQYSIWRFYLPHRLM